MCNHVAYGVLYKIHKERLYIKAGFIHVPFIPEQVVDKPERAKMSLENIVKSIEIVCRVLAPK